MGFIMTKANLIILLEKIIDMLQAFLDNELDLKNPEHEKLSKIVKMIHSTIDFAILMLNMFI